ncbi:MAG: trans-sulfuration enzyme family protein [Flammeovirgaceae bacterium]
MLLDTKLSEATHCVHTGTQQLEGDRGVNSPIITSSAFDYGAGLPNQYPRYFNLPNQEAVVQKLCALEGAESGLLTSSGMSAISTVFMGLLEKGDHVIFQNNLYGGTHYFIAQMLERFGIAYTVLVGNTIAEYEEAIQPNTRLIYIETPSNPLLKITDIRAIAHLAKGKGILTMIDNTFASPINQQPIKLGIDVVIHSATKYLGGHSDICAGVIATSQELLKPIYVAAVNFGGCLDARVCYLLERSMKTLALRVQRQNENALKLAEFLEKEEQIGQVNYPGLASHPDHHLAASQMLGGFGGMLSFEIKAGPAKAEAFVAKLKVISKALSLGGVESTICSPAQTTHIKISQAERDAQGIKDELLRLSVGIEEVNDLIYDIEQALCS